MKLKPWVRTGLLLASGAIGLGAMQLFLDNRDVYAKLDLVNAIADADLRNRQGDAFFGPDAPDPADEAIAAEFLHCGGSVVDKSKGSMAMVQAQILRLDLGFQDEESVRREFRRYVAYNNGILALEKLKLCRAWGGCKGDWWASLTHRQFAPIDRAAGSVDATRFQMAKDYACGVAVRLARGQVRSKTP